MNFSFGPESKSVLLYSGIGTLLVVAFGSCFLIWRGFASDLYCESVMRIINFEGNVYAKTIDREYNTRNYQSLDGGITWNRFNNVPRSVEDELNSVNIADLDSICHPDNKQICYRIVLTDKEKTAPEFPGSLEKSMDSGKTWQEMAMPTGLQIKPGCRDYHPKSLAIVELEADQGKHNLIVSIAEGGVLVLLPNGEWLQREF